MREYIFRGKRLDSGEWVEGHLTWSEDAQARITPHHSDIFGVSNGDCIIPGTEKAILHIAYAVDPETVGQYTGLTDKNGKKLFEGDILRTGTRMGYMLFEKGCFRFRWKNFDKYRPDFFKTCIITEYGSFRELEVIGNIHDNPELLKGGD